MKANRVGRVGGLQVSSAPSAPISWLSLAAAATLWIRRQQCASWRRSAAGGMAALLLHLLAVVWHQLGHARAAAGTGFPMAGLRFYGLLSASVYPPDEPALPPEIHAQRAVGGPVASLVLGAAIALLALLLRPVGRLPYALALLAAADNLLVFFLGALAPLGFTDGSTLLRAWQQRRNQADWVRVHE